MQHTRQALGLLACLLASPAGMAQVGGCGNFTPAQAEAALNAWRAEGGRCGGLKALPPGGALHWDPRLAQAAQRQADDMAQRRQLTHAGSDGSRGGERLDAAGYEWGAWAENIARGQRDLPAVLRAWSRSAGHCRNALDPRFRHLGLACAQPGGGGPPFWALVLAAPPP